jgi:hypothetical protein
MRPKIAWNGGLYSHQEFLRTMHAQYPEVIYWRCRGDTEIPAGKLKKRDLEGWIAFANSSTTTASSASPQYSASVTTP